MPGDLLTVSADAREHVTVLCLAGEVDATSAPALEAALSEAAKRDRPVIVDVSDLSYIDSSGFRVIYLASQRIPVAIVVSPASVLSRTIRLAGIGDSIAIFPDIDTACAQGAQGKQGSSA